MLCEKCKNFAWSMPYRDGEHHPACPDHPDNELNPIVVNMGAPSLYGATNVQIPLVDPNGKLIVDYKKPKVE
jgi:hypothetical protein